jgi:hypothetical protein
MCVGVGGGGIFVPILILITSFDPKDAIPLSNVRNLRSCFEFYLHIVTNCCNTQTCFFLLVRQLSVLQQLQIGSKWVENGTQKLIVHSSTIIWLSLFNLLLLQALSSDFFSTGYSSMSRLSTLFAIRYLILTRSF